MSDPKSPDNGKKEFSTMHERVMAQKEEAQRAAEQDLDIEVGIFDGVRDREGNPVQPVKLTKNNSFCFSCHKGVSCWNKCCYSHDITLTPFDILRLSRHLDVKPAEFLKIFTVPAIHEGSGLPVAKLRVQGKDGTGPCAFLDEDEGCTVYEDRPVNCRYYPLGLAAVKMKGHEKAEDFFFLVKETHCKGHEEDKEQTVGEFQTEQGIDPYDEQNRGWMEILMKMASWRVMGGPFGTEVDPRTAKMFFMCSTDVEAFRRFVFETKFLKTYDIDDDMIERLASDDELVLQLGFDFMKTIMFNEDGLKMRDEVMQDSIAEARVNFRAGS